MRDGSYEPKAKRQKREAKERARVSLSGLALYVHLDGGLRGAAARWHCLAYPPGGLVCICSVTGRLTDSCCLKPIRRCGVGLGGRRRMGRARRRRQQEGGQGQRHQEEQEGGRRRRGRAR